MHKKPQPDKNSRARIHTSCGLRKAPASVNELLAKKPRLRALSAARPPEDWRAWLESRLPQELSMHLRGVLLKAEELIVYAENASWSSRLRYALAALMAEISARDARIQRAVARVAPMGTARLRA